VLNSIWREGPQEFDQTLQSHASVKIDKVDFNAMREASANGPFGGFKGRWNTTVEEKLFFKRSMQFAKEVTNEKLVHPLGGSVANDKTASAALGHPDRSAGLVTAPQRIAPGCKGGDAVRRGICEPLRFAERLEGIQHVQRA
jgi:hypothetical protein